MTDPSSFIVRTDPDAAPSNWDAALAKYLLRIVRAAADNSTPDEPKPAADSEPGEQENTQ